MQLVIFKAILFYIISNLSFENKVGLKANESTKVVALLFLIYSGWSTEASANFKFEYLNSIKIIITNTLLMIQCLHSRFYFKERSKFNYLKFKTIFLAPIVEEIFFRYYFFLEIAKSNQDTIKYILTSSLIFSISHFKAKETCKTNLFILAFTFIFGVYASTVYSKTNDLLSVICLHGYCNYLGVPTFVNRTKETKHLSMLLMCLGPILAYVSFKILFN